MVSELCKKRRSQEEPGKPGEERGSLTPEKHGKA
jgi:hypothetical protein